ncbi:DUF7344 domain-containing protein [Natronococcus wangiae]|uniref:DUF7344 domain-containing protein n=1 Tax=Natronococcus wangiae TaxID=3068275 RepID=UPI00273EE2AB|nr:hypothetical protein [Natronococcus sp. AD5]
MGHGSSELDVVFELLANHRRRRALAVLKTDDRRLTLNDLTKEIAVQESDARITEIPGEDVCDIFLSLQHIHAPKLAAFELIEYDRKRDIVEPTDRLETLEPYLSLATGADFDPEPRTGQTGAQ